MVRYYIKKVDNPNLVKEFVVNSGDSLFTFRYFNNRNYDVINNHLITYLLFEEHGVPIGYGHLEFEGGKLWLGIAISEKYKGFGFGSKMLETLINFAKKKEILSIFLTVDVGNVAAINLYKKYGFHTIVLLKENVQMMKLDLSL